MREGRQERSARLGEVEVEALLPWEECDVFCIRGYGGGAAVVCGWRGAWFQAVWDAQRQVRVCPHCGQTTLMGLPSGGGYPAPGAAT